MDQKRTPHNSAGADTNDHSLVRFLTRFRTPLIATGATIIVAVVALLIVLSVQSNRMEDARLAAEDLEDSYADWLALDEGERESAFAEIREQAATVREDFAGTYAAVRAYMVEGDGLFELEQWSDAALTYEQAATLAAEDVGERAYLAPVALMDAAIAAENAGETDRALEFYRTVSDEYGDISPEAPRAAFSVARILESLDRIDEAADAYRSVVDDYPASSWTNMARNRIITLTVEGRIGG